ncbi:PREDICTED: uncharacterized protein LOC109238717 [Nicotiana attenuata]|uniref:uncharacterized protein LOC109238717 n=1 Tax=Nicotiana attenuata TaxID=49451 RepID=UPI0009045F8E|nr:PREDICTED: uncharacterized protein LOC109238717 [Nicotiana attenuata]
MVTVRSIVALAASRHWMIYQMDVHNAFLNGDLVEEVYMHIPQGFVSQGETKKVFKLHKSLYGFKQAPRQWNMKLTEVLLQMGFKRSHYDYSLFIREANGDTIIIRVYVDDLLITGNNDKSLYDTRIELQKKFKMKDLGELKSFLGIEFSISKERILMCQRMYALELISETGLGGATPSGTPLELNQKLISVEYDKCIQSSKQEGDQELKDPSCYQRLVGRLLYLAMTRPDIAFAVQVLCQYMHCPKVSHMEASLKVVRYIKQGPGLGLLIPAENANKMVAYCDSERGYFIESGRSVTGYLVKFGNALVSWKSKKQMTVSRSSADAEFRSMASCAAEVT